MNHRDFFYLVAQVREAQKAYLKTRDGNVFRAVRKLENELDREIERVRQIVSANPANDVVQSERDPGNS